MGDQGPIYILLHPHYIHISQTATFTEEQQCLYMLQKEEAQDKEGEKYKEDRLQAA